jgi:hypothetical protein
MATIKEGKFEYRTVVVDSPQGFAQAEKLQSMGWKAISTGVNTIIFEKASMRVTMKEALISGNLPMGVPIGNWRIKITVTGEMYGLDSDVSMVSNSATKRGMKVISKGKNFVVIEGEAPVLSGLIDSLNRLNTFEGKIERA